MDLVLFKGRVTINVPMLRVLNRLQRNQLLNPGWSHIKTKFGTNPLPIIDHYESVALGLLTILLHAIT